MGYLGLGVISNIMSFSYGLGALPGGMIFNRFGPKSLSFCFLGSTLACLFISASPNLLVFTIGLAILGALGSVYHPLANALISTKVKEFGRGLGVPRGGGEHRPGYGALSCRSYRVPVGMAICLPGIYGPRHCSFDLVPFRRYDHRQAAEAKPAGSGRFPILFKRTGDFGSIFPFP